MEALNDLMTQKNLSLQKAVELRMEQISQNKDNNFSTWEALKNDYLNEEKKNHRATTVRDLELRLIDFWNVLNKNQYQEIAKLCSKDFMIYI